MGTTREPVDIEFVLKGDIEKDIHKVEQNIKSMGKEGDVSYKKLQSASFETFQALSKENQIRAVALQDTIKRMKANENEQREATAQFKSKTISADEYAKAMARLSVRSAELKSTAAGLSAQVQKEIQMNQMVEGSYDKKIAKLDALRKEYKSLTVEEMKNAEVGGKMITQIRQLEKETGKVDEALKGAGRGVMGFINRMEQAPGVIGSTVGGMKQLIVQSLKFIATPIGAIIAAIVVGLKLLTTWFHRSAEGENAMITASAYFSQILDSLLNVVAKVGEWLYKAWEKPLDALKDLVQFMKDQVINRFVGLGNIFISLKDIGVNSFKLIKASIQDIWSDQDAAIKESKEGFKNAAKDMANAYGQVLTGIENPLDKLVDFAKETTEQADKRAAIAAELHKLDLQELQTKKEVAETEVKIAELREKAKNNETDERERLKYIKEAQRLTDEIDKKQIAELAKRLDLTRQKLLLEKGVTDVNKLTLEDLRTLNDLELQILSKQEEKSNRMRALLDQQNAINGKIATEKTATELINKELELKKEAYQTYYRFIAATDKAYANERFADLVKGGESYLEYINRKIEELKGKQTRSKTEDVQLSAYQGEKMEIMGTSNPVDVLRREMEEKKKLYADDIEAYQKYLQDKKALLEGDTTDMGPSMRTVVDAELTDANTAVQKNLDELV
ncbi:MAG TPA: hypothetical protein DIW50_03420, partial [Prolixibacteraceae bacterium]|nr:hypothetical protein [Prolixibacteraceae bacterium]